MILYFVIRCGMKKQVGCQSPKKIIMGVHTLAKTFLASIIEEQAIGRAVRLGQSHQVQVKRLVMRDTIEHDYYCRNLSAPDALIT